MPTLGTHFDDEQAKELQKIAANSLQKKIGPWIREAVNQRLEREGFIPGTPAFDVRAEAASAAEFAGADKVLAALRALKADHYSAATPAA